MDLNKYFVDKGVYKLKGNKSEIIFICEALPGNGIGKLVAYDKLIDNIYNKTGMSYFLNSFIEGDIKELFTQRENYDMIGLIGNNYEKNSTNDSIIKM